MRHSLADLPPFDALIFDCDGTLVLSSTLHLDAFSAALGEQGCKLDPGWYAARTGLARHDLLRAYAAGVAPLDVPLAVARSIDLTLTIAGACRENPAVAALARHWQGRVPMAVASNAEAPVVWAMLAACNLTALFDPVITLTEAVIPKPDPAMFLMAAAAMRVPAARCLVLEDSDQGLAAAAAAGMAAVDVR